MLLHFLGNDLSYDEGATAKSNVVPVKWCIWMFPSSIRNVYFPGGAVFATCNVKTEVIVSFESKTIGFTVNVELNSSSLAVEESEGWLL